MTDRPDIRPWLRVGLTASVAGLGGFLLWAATAPLAGGAVADGVVQVDGHRKELRHKDGGIVSEILVREGDRVTAGQVLLRMEDIDARALSDLLQAQRDTLAARQARLAAEGSGAAAIAFPDDLAARDHVPQVAEILAGERRILASRRDGIEREKAILSQRVEQQRSMVAALDAQLRAARRQVALLAEERDAIAGLVDQGLAPRPRLMALSRELADRHGLVGDLIARIAAATEAAAEAEMRLAALEPEREKEVALELRQVQLERAEAEEKLRSARAQLARTDIRAPRDGLVLGLRHHTVGGVVAAGETLLELVPDDDTLVIDARIRPVDIAAVQPGLAAKVRLAATSRDMPMIDGRVLTVSADALTDDRTGQPFYAALVEVAPPPGLALMPGMPVSVLVVAEERTVLGYLTRPIADSFFRAFSER